MRVLFRARSVVAVGLFLFGSVAAATSPALAQTGTAALTGRVTDPQGLPLPGVTLTLTNPSTKESRTALTNESGRYRFIAVPPGQYNLVMVLTGFKSVTFQNLALRVDFEARQDAQLEVGALTESVSVVSENRLTNTTDASVGNQLTTLQIQRLPIEALNIVGLLSLQPGVVFIPTTNPSTTDPRYGAVAGARADQQTVTLDGIDVNDPQLQAAFTSAVRVTQAALQEFRVSTTNYGADQGRSSGAQVSMVTRSGNNRVDGSAYWFLRRTATSTNEYFLDLTQTASGQPSVAPLLDKDIYGGAVGGPIRRDKIFFFANYEKLSETSESPVVRAVPSQSFRDGVLMYRCATASACPGGSVAGFTGTHAVAAGWYGLTPAELRALDPLGIGPSRAASDYFKTYPLPNEPGLDGKNIMDYRFKSPIKNDFKTFIARLDYKPTTNQTIFGRFNIQDDAIASAQQFEQQAPASLTVFDNFGTAMGWDKVLSRSLVNSFRYGYTRIDTGSLGRVNDNFVNFRFISPYEPQTFTSKRQTPTHNIVNDLSWLKGAHTLKFGANLRFTRIPATRDSGSWLSSSVNPSWVAGIGRTYMPGRLSCTTPGCSAVPAVASNFAAGYADTWLNILGVLSQSNLRANYDRNGTPIPVGQAVQRTYASDEYDFYVQDSWQVTKTLTLTGGLRYGLYSPPYETNGLQVAPTISMGEWFEQRRQNGLNGIPSNKSPIITFDLAGPANNKRGFYDWDLNNVAPRIAVAWNPVADSGFMGWLTGGDRLVVRGGYSKVFDRIGQGLALNFDSGFSYGMSTSVSSPFGAPYETNPAVRFVDLKTMPPTMPAAPPGGFPQTPPIRAGIITSSIDDTIVTPSAHMLNVMVARGLGGNYTVEAGYIGRFGRDLLTRRDLAMPLNLKDLASGKDYFTAAQEVIRATQNAGISANASASAYAVLANNAYWENMFPAAAGGGLSATQAIARSFNLNAPDYITSLWEMDQFCDPACSKFGPFAYFAEQYDSLAAVSSVGRSDYNSLQFTLRKGYSNGYQFDFNYTLSESWDLGSNVERGSAFGNFGAGGYSGFLINSWNPELNWGYSDFDVRHQINFNWILDLPFGTGRAIGTDSGAFMDALIGDWSFSGVTRWSSGFPFSVQNCRSCWPTNWNLQGNATLKDPNVRPETKLTENAVDGRPSPFVDPAGALALFRYSLPGESGDRNIFRGDGYSTLDFSLSKSWHLGMGNSLLRFRWDVFNVTNTPSFDVASLTMLPDRSGFGRYDSTLATCDARAGRCMQFGFKFEF